MCSIHSLFYTSKMYSDTLKALLSYWVCMSREIPDQQPSSYLILTNAVNRAASFRAEWGHPHAADHIGKNKQMRLRGVCREGRGELKWLKRGASPCGVPACRFLWKVLCISFQISTKSAEAREREALCPLQGSRKKRLNELKADIWDTCMCPKLHSLLGRQKYWARLVRGDEAIWYMTPSCVYTIWNVDPYSMNILCSPLCVCEWLTCQRNAQKY